MSTWDDKPNDYEHALEIIECLRAENERLRGMFQVSDAENDELRAENSTMTAERDALLAALVEIAGYPQADARELKAIARAAIKSSSCPHPANAAPDYITVEQCVARDECGCDSGDAIKQVEGG